MKSFCIKTNNNKIIEYLLNCLDSVKMQNIYYINKKFKLYENLIIHYTGESSNSFLNLLSDMITDCILLFYEPYLIKRIINYDYFYFDDFEKKLVEENCYSFIISNNDDSLKYRKTEVWTQVLKYLSCNKCLILDGFVNFRLEDYMQSLNYIVEYSVSEYIVEKEYNEFINLLKIYIDSKQSNSNIVHLIYTNGESILLDDKKNIIPLTSESFNAKYLSDISFSSNDYALNALLTLLPKKIEIHLIGYEDEFINTLKLVFLDRITICTDCNICRTYKVLNNVR